MPNALSTITPVDDGGKDGGPVFVDRVSLAGVSSYATPGSTGFLAKFKLALGENRTILGVFATLAKGYRVNYDITNDLLKVFWSTGDDGVDEEVDDGTDLHLVVFELVVISK